MLWLENADNDLNMWVHSQQCWKCCLPRRCHKTLHLSDKAAIIPVH